MNTNTEKSLVPVYLALIAGIVAFLLSIHFLIIPFAVGLIANTFPKDLEQQLGDNYFQLLTQTSVIDSVKTAQIKAFAREIDFKTDYALDFYVVESDVVNAFALPGGKIVVFSGLIDKMTKPKQLLALMGHEAAHVALRHSLKNIFRDQSYSIILGAITGGSHEIIQGLVGFTSTLNSLHGSRQAEQEADLYSLEVLYHNQLDPKGAIELFQILQNEESLAIPEFLSTHSASENRIKDLEEAMSEQPKNFFKKNPTLEQLFNQLKK